MARVDPLFVGIGGRVVALDRASGDIVWSKRLSAGSSLVPLTRDAHHLYAISAGEVTCLDPATGDVLWHNPLKGFGVGFATFAQDASATVPSVAAIAAARAAATAVPPA